MSKLLVVFKRYDYLFTKNHGLNLNYFRRKEYVELSKSDIERIKKFNSSLLKNEYTQFKLFSESITEQILKINSKKFIKQPNEHH